MSFTNDNNRIAIYALVGKRAQALPRLDLSGFENLRGLDAPTVLQSAVNKPDGSGSCRLHASTTNGQRD